MKIKTIWVAVMLIAALVATGATSCFAYGGGECAKGGKDDAKCAEMKQKMVKELGLTPEQDKKLEENRTAQREQMKGLREAIKANKTALDEAMKKPGVTRAEVEPIVTEMKALNAKMLDQRIDGIFAVKQILTPEQFAKFQEKTHKKWGEKHGKGGHEGERRGPPPPPEEETE